MTIQSQLRRIHGTQRDSYRQVCIQTATLLMTRQIKPFLAKNKLKIIRNLDAAGRIRTGEPLRERIAHWVPSPILSPPPLTWLGYRRIQKTIKHKRNLSVACLSFTLLVFELSTLRNIFCLVIKLDKRFIDQQTAFLKKGLNQVEWR